MTFPSTCRVCSVAQVRGASETAACPTPETSPLYLHELGHVPHADLSSLGGCGEKVGAASEAVAGDLVGAVGAGELGGAGGQSDGQRNVLGVFSLDKGAIGRVALVLRPDRTQSLEC